MINSFSHKNNLLQKKKRSLSLSSEFQEIVNSAISRYANYLRSLNWSEIKQNNLENSVGQLEDYIDYAKDLERQYSFFNWRSDYASSIIPEFIHRVLLKRLTEQNIPNVYSTKKSIVEISLVSGSNSSWSVREKNQDLCLGAGRERFIFGERIEHYVIPSIVFEVKTNIDINKINGLDYSAEKLKKSFPVAKYFLVTETVDFSLGDNFISTSLDEIYCLRKQMRSVARRNKSKLCYEVFEELVNDVENTMRLVGANRGHVYDRLPKGKLIDV